MKSLVARIMDSLMFETPEDRDGSSLKRDIAAALIAANLLAEAASKSLEAERNRRKKLKSNSPASTYTDARIAEIEAAIEAWKVFK